MLLVALLAACNWPLAHLETEPLTTASGPATAFVSPLATPDKAVTRPTPTAVQEHGQRFSGRSLRFDLPAGYQVLEGLDGGCFLYHESLPGFLVLYPATGDPGETLASLFQTTAHIRRREPPLEVDLGGLTFGGLFVETEADERLFLAAAEGWVLVVQGPVGDWPTLAGALNRVLTSLSFKEGF